MLGPGVEQRGPKLAPVVGRFWGKLVLGATGQRPRTLAGAGPGRFLEEGCLREATGVLLALGCDPGQGCRQGRGQGLPQARSWDEALVWLRVRLPESENISQRGGALAGPRGAPSGHRRRKSRCFLWCRRGCAFPGALCEEETLRGPPWPDLLSAARPPPLPWGGRRGLGGHQEGESNPEALPGMWGTWPARCRHCRGGGGVPLAFLL